jgi:hypothetical protein
MCYHTNHITIKFFFLIKSFNSNLSYIFFNFVLVLVILILIFFLDYFVKVVINFNLIFNCNLSYIIFFNLVILLLISKFFRGSSVNILVVFNFTFQPKFFMFCFFFSNLVLILLIYFHLFINLFFNLTLQSKDCSFPLIFFYFNFHPYSFN